MDSNCSDNTWIVLDEGAASPGSRPSSRNSVPRLADISDLYDHQAMPIRRTPDGLKASLSMGIEYQDSMSQAERSLGLAVKLDGIDDEFLRRSTERISEIQSRKAAGSPFSQASETTLSDEAEFPFEGRNSPSTVYALTAAATEAVAARNLKYGGRAPPLGAVPPRATMLRSASSPSVDQNGYPSRKASPDIGARHCISPFTAAISDALKFKMVCSKRGDKNESIGIYEDKQSEGATNSDSCLSFSVCQHLPKTNKAERRRQRMEKRALKSRKSINILYELYEFVFGRISDDFLRVIPLILSHAFTLAAGFYIGHRYFFVDQEK